MRKALVFALALGLGFADWISERVEKELADFPEKSIERAKIAVAAEGGEGLTPYAEAAHIVIEGGWARVRTFLTTGDCVAAHRLKRLIRDINIWQKSAKTRPSRKLPDTEFLLSLSEGIEANSQSRYVNARCYGVPVFTFAKRKETKQLVLFPDSYALASWKKVRRDIARGKAAFPWERKEDHLFWQGIGNDGIYTKNNWRAHTRARLVLLAREKPDLIAAHFTGYLYCCDRLAFDDILKAIGPFAQEQSPQTFIKHKYLMYLEGASLDWTDMFTALLSNSALFKQDTRFIQWYSDELKPWVHYVPVKGDLSDLEQQIAWAKENDAHVQAIAHAGQKRGQELFDRRVTFEYIQRLLLAYNRRLVP